MHWDLVCEELDSFSQQASAEAEAYVSLQTCPFVCVNYVSAVSVLAARAAEILECAFGSKEMEIMKTGP